jgi:TnpA family transposase
MPVEPETGEALPATIDADRLRKFFTLLPADQVEVRRCRATVLRLGFAVQLCTLRWRGHFLWNLADLPAGIVETLADQLGRPVVALDGYPGNEDTRLDHGERLRRHLGFVRCGAAQRQALRQHLIDAAAAAPRLSTLHQIAVAWLLDQRIVRPGTTTLREILGAAREAAFETAYRRLTEDLTTAQRTRIDNLLVVPDEDAGDSRPVLTRFKTAPARASAGALLLLVDRLSELQALEVATLPALNGVHPATRRLLASWANRYTVWHLRRFPSAKRHAIVVCFLQMALAETIDALVEMQDKLITRIHNQAHDRYAALLRAGEEARSRAVAAVEQIGTLVLDDGIPEVGLRDRIFERVPRPAIGHLIEECRKLRQGLPASPLALTAHWYGYVRRYAPALLEAAPLRFAAGSELATAVDYLKIVNRERRRRLDAGAPLGFLPRRWPRYVVLADDASSPVISRPHYEIAVLTVLNERIKSGAVTLDHSRRWTDFEDYLILRAVWEAERDRHYAALGLPREADAYLARLDADLKAVTAMVEARVPANHALRIKPDAGEFHLAKFDALGSDKAVKALIERRLPPVDLVDILIDLDHQTDFLRHFLHSAGGSGRLSPPIRRRNVMAALIAVGCNIGAWRMAAASPGVSVQEINQAADWHITEDALKAATIDLVNYAGRLPISRIWGTGTSCSSDGVRFHVPVNVLAADYSAPLRDRGVTLLAHTADNYLRLHHKPIPCRLREALFTLDGLVEHDTELDPRSCYTDSHGFTEVVMATGALLGFSIEPRIADIKDQTLYKIDRTQRYPHLDPILAGTIRPHLIRAAWDETVRVIASIKARIVAPSLILNRLGSYARRNSIHQALAEIGRVHKSMFILRYLDDEEYRRHISRELNKGETSHGLSRFLCFGKDGAIRGREFQDQLHTFSCLGVLHNAVIAWNALAMTSIVEPLRDSHVVTDADLAHVAPLMHRHINPFGQYRFDLARIRTT